MLNYGPNNNFILRPAQEMEIEEFHTNDKIKQVYIHLKSLKDLLSYWCEILFDQKDCFAARLFGEGQR